MDSIDFLKEKEEGSRTWLGYESNQLPESCMVGVEWPTLLFGLPQLLDQTHRLALNHRH